MDLMCEIFVYLQAAQGEEMDDFGGPKAVILEQMHQKMDDIRRIGTCYLGVAPPSSHVYVNNSYDSNGLNVSEHTKRFNFSTKIIFNKFFFSIC